MAFRNDKFRLDITRIIKKAKGRLDIVPRKITLELFSRVILRSPVDTGRFRNNWVMATGSYSTETTEATDKSGGKAIGIVASKINSMKFDGQKIYLTNSLPYAIELERGSSKQAPQGMVRLTALEIVSKYGGR
jgi:hypothetical protein